jgi:hypothetical protein
MNKQAIKTALQQQVDSLINRGRIPCFEFERMIDNEKEWFVVDFEVTDKGVEFSFDQANLAVSFDGNIEQLSENYFLIPFDNAEYLVNNVESLDEYLYVISDNIRDGYLYSNGIATDSEE